MYSYVRNYQMVRKIMGFNVGRGLPENQKLKIPSLRREKAGFLTRDYIENGKYMWIMVHILTTSSILRGQGSHFLQFF
jgi:hypothetical protein